MEGWTEYSWQMFHLHLVIVALAIVIVSLTALL
jgi:hypothetical protein